MKILKDILFSNNKKIETKAFISTSGPPQCRSSSSETESKLQIVNFLFWSSWTSTWRRCRFHSHRSTLAVFLSFFFFYKLLCCLTDPAPPRSLYAVNATHSSVTLLWSEEGVADHYQVTCRPSRGSKEPKVSHCADQTLSFKPEPPFWTCFFFKRREKEEGL